MSKFSIFKDHTTICSSAPSEVLAIVALRAKESIIKRNLGIIQNNLKVVNRFFSAHSGLSFWAEPWVGSVAFPKLTANIPINRFCQAMLEKKNVMILPGDLFEFPGNHFRVSLDRKNLLRALERTEKYLHDSGLNKL